MNLLLTNDDGISSIFLHELVRALQLHGHAVFVIAPKTEQSWIGCAKSRHRHVTSARVDVGLECPTWTVDGTPSDCVNIGLAHLLPRTVQIDAVVSGINIGRNASLGFILASGTIGGAWEGAVHGLPSLAFSQDLTSTMFEELHRARGQPDPVLLETLQTSAAHAARLVPLLSISHPPKSFIVHNVNFPVPCTHDTPLVQTVPAQVIVPSLFSPAADDGTHRFVFHLGEECSPKEPLTDRSAIESGKMSHTVLDYRALGHAFSRSLK